MRDRDGEFPFTSEGSSSNDSNCPSLIRFLMPTVTRIKYSNESKFRRPFAIFFVAHFQNLYSIPDLMFACPCRAAGYNALKMTSK